jgi:putative membrane protein insertion efficiency factor
MKSALLLLLRLYKLAVSPYLGQNCRFYPSCSEYAHEAIVSHGALRGTLLAGKRLCKCHPWHAGGVDPVPTVAGSVSEHSASPDTASPGSISPLPLQPPAVAANPDRPFRPIAD